MDNDLISREALKEKAIWTKVNDGVELIDIEVVPLDAIDNAQAIPFPNEQIAWEQGYEAGLAQGKHDRPQGEWGKWIISEIRCPICSGYFQPDCYSTEELNECPNCGANMRKGGAE